MISSFPEYKFYLERDRIASQIPTFDTLSSKIKNLLFPNEQLRFLKALRFLEYSENVNKGKLGTKIWLFAKIRFRKISIKYGYSIPINVFGPGAKIFGDIYIADNISIGANATVNNTFVETNVILAGTPAKIVKTNVPSWNRI